MYVAKSKNNAHFGSYNIIFYIRKTNFMDTKCWKILLSFDDIFFKSFLTILPEYF